MRKYRLPLAASGAARGLALIGKRCYTVVKDIMEAAHMTERIGIVQGRHHALGRGRHRQRGQHLAAGRGRPWTGPYTARRGRACSKSAAPLGGCQTGRAKITKGYDLKARYVLHTPGPVWHGGGRGEAEALASCYTSCLELASRYGCRTVDFPSNLHRRLRLPGR